VALCRHPDVAAERRGEGVGTGRAADSTKLSSPRLTSPSYCTFLACRGLNGRAVQSVSGGHCDVVGLGSSPPTRPPQDQGPDRDQERTHERRRDQLTAGDRQ